MITISFLDKFNFNIQKLGLFVEEYEFQQISSYFFHVLINSNLFQIEIYPGNFDIPIILGGEPEIPEISRMEFIGDFDSTKIEEISNFPLNEISENPLSSLKRPKLVGISNRLIYFFLLLIIL
jgi:hypothetical protein